MKMTNRRTLIAAIAVGAALGTAAVALATPPSGLVGTPLARGSAGELTIQDKSQKLKVQVKESMDVALVKATLAPNGFTGWHAHAAPSIAIVQSGSMTVYEANGDECVSRTQGAGTAFVHSEDAHNFVAGPAGAEVYIVYLLPAGASPAPIDVTPAPSACS